MAPMNTKMDGMWMLRRAADRISAAFVDARNEHGGYAWIAVDRLRKNAFWIGQKPSRDEYTVIEGHEAKAINSLMLSGYIIHD